MKEVNREELVPNKEYLLEGLTYDNNNNLIPIRPAYKMTATFEKLEEIPDSNGFKFAFFNNFRKFNIKKTCGYDVHLNLCWKFYEKKGETIQQDMETRALNKIIQSVLNDEYFKIDFI